MAPVPNDASTAAPISQLVTVPSHDKSYPPYLSFKCAVTDSKGPRRTMEDAHSIVVPFAGIHGQGFFAIFDGHAGKQAAEWCGQNFSLCLLDALRRHPEASIPDILNQTFHEVDSRLSRMAEESDGKMHSGCTAVTAFLRLEDADGKQTFLPPDFDPFQANVEMIEADVEDSDSNNNNGTIPEPPHEKKKKSSRSKIRDALRHIGGSSSKNESSSSISTTSSPDREKEEREKDQFFTPSGEVPLRRVLYCANAGDARGVLCRAGKAVRLTYDHKGSDKQEAKRIMDAGGFVMSGRVNGVLAVTRSLGDSSMKEFVVGAPYTTETELSEEDEFLILACDGLWDVVDDQGAVSLVRGIADPKRAAEELLEYAYRKYSTDNVTVLVVRFRNPPESLQK